MTLSITPSFILSNVTAQESAHTAISDAIDGSAMVALGIHAQVTMNASATAGATVKVYAGYDSGHLGSYAVQEVDMPYVSGVTAVAFSVLPGHKVYYVRVLNLDPTYDITAIYVTAMPQILT